MNKNIPNFFVVGAPKCGTTSIHAFLESHPEIFMSTPKELNYFNSKEINQQKLYYPAKVISKAEDYMGIFEPVQNEKVIGEASVSYLYYDETPKRIFEYNNDAKILILLRDPVSRAYSHYLMDDRLGLVNKSFENIFRTGPDNQDNLLHFQQYFLLGNYSDQIKRYLDVFPAQNVKIILSENLKSDISNSVKEILRFLEIDDSIELDTSKKHNVEMSPKSKIIKRLYGNSQLRSILKGLIGTIGSEKIKGLLFNKSSSKKLSADMTRDLVNYYEEDIMKTSDIIGVNLNHWLK